MSDPSLIFADRQLRLASAVQDAGLRGIMLNPGPSLVYLTGLHFHLSERPVVAIFRPGQPVVIALPELESLKIENLPFAVRAFTYGEDPTFWPQVFSQAAHGTGLQDGKIGIEPRQFRVLELRLMESALPEVAFVSAEDAVATLRMRKDATEISAMRKAVEIAQAALQATLPFIKPGVTEKAIAAELVSQLLRHGSSGELPFMPIVSGGPNSANPHATPSDRQLRNGDLLVIDWGAAWDGYFSDLTRTFAIGEVDAEYRRIHETVQRSSAAGRAASKPGVPASDIDYAARSVIEAEGYGEFFTHRTGHGLGMESHEPPYMRGDNPLVLQTGMTFTVEPGIYLPGRNGVRIEDNMVITADGAESFSDFPRELIILTGK
jgi:Xaa-Pro dipeptidase